MIAGVNLNGRHYRQGDACQYVTSVRSGDQNEQSHESARKIGRIQMFYTVDVASHGRLRPETFFTVSDIPVIRLDRAGMHIVDMERCAKHLAGFDHRFRSGDRLLHIDRVEYKIMLAPHYDLASHPDEMCAIEMWQAR